MSSSPSILNVVGFSVFSTFAQLGAATSRVAILAYTMPIWAVLLGWLVSRRKADRHAADRDRRCAPPGLPC